MWWADDETDSQLIVPLHHYLHRHDCDCDWTSSRRLAYGPEPFWVAESSRLRPYVEAVVVSLQVEVEAVGDQCEVVVAAAGVVVAGIRPAERAAVACPLEEEEEEGIQGACQVSVAYAYAYRGEVVP
jgi:hypothetical protein